VKAEIQKSDAKIGLKNVNYGWQELKRREVIISRRNEEEKHDVVQTQNNKNQVSNISSRKSNYKSTIIKCHLSATEVLFLFIFISFNPDIVGKDVFLVSGGRKKKKQIRAEYIVERPP